MWPPGDGGQTVCTIIHGHTLGELCGPASSARLGNEPEEISPTRVRSLSFLNQRRCDRPWCGHPNNFSDPHGGSWAPSSPTAGSSSPSCGRARVCPTRPGIRAGPTTSCSAAWPRGRSGHQPGAIWKSHRGGNPRRKAPCHRGEGDTRQKGLRRPPPAV